MISEITKATAKRKNFVEMKVSKSLFAFESVRATKVELVPKSIIFARETKRLVSSAYFPKVSIGRDWATAARKTKPNPALKIFPKVTKEMFNKGLFLRSRLSLIFLSTS